MKKNLKIILFYVALIFLFLLVISSVFGTGKKETVSYSQIAELFQNEEVKNFVVSEKNVVTITTHDGRTVEYALRDFAIFYEDFSQLILEQSEAGIIESYDYQKPKEVSVWVSYLPFVIIIVLFAALWIYMIKSATGRGGKVNSFGRVKAKPASDDKNKVLFKDVAGADEEKEELREVVDFLRDPTKYTKLGAKIPHGVLLVGPPGTGKTLLAKAVAGEAGVPFFSISGSDFVEMYVGVGASRVRDLFETAKKTPASIVFIDEIDAVGRHRGAGLGGGHDEREQTLNQLLVEMDGFSSNEGVIVIAATNRPDILDPALLRPGRFDRQITVGYPDIKGREDILKVHAKGKPFEKDVDLAVIAKTTVGFTGADLANLLNEAALLSARKGKSLIGMTDIEEAMIKVMVGPKKKSKVISEKEKKLTAYHEAGHAVVTHVLMPETPVHQISIIPSGMAGGYTLSLPKEDRSYASKTYMENEIVTLLGGRVSESLFIGDISTGASNDIARSTSIARSIVTKYGMTDSLGPIVYGSEHNSDEVFLGRDFNETRNYSEETASKIDDEIKRIIDEAYAKAKKILTENEAKIHAVSAYLIKHEIMDEDLFNRLMTDDSCTMEDLEKMEEEKRRRSDEENLEKMRAEEAAKAAAEEEERKRRESEIKLGNGSGIDAYARQVRSEDKKNDPENKQ